MMQIAIADSVRFTSRFFVMLRTVEFNHGFERSAVKINDIWANYFLPIHSVRELLEEVIPKVTLFLCHFPSKGF